MREVENKEILKIAKESQVYLEQYYDLVFKKRRGLDKMLVEVRKKYPKCSRNRLYRIQKKEQLYVINKHLNVGKPAVDWLTETIKYLITDSNKRLHLQALKFGYNSNRVKALKRRIESYENNLNTIGSILSICSEIQRDILTKQRINYGAWVNEIGLFKLYRSTDLKKQMEFILDAIKNWIWSYYIPCRFNIDLIDHDIR